MTRFKGRKALLGSGASAASPDAIKKLEDLEKQSNEAANTLDDDNWGRTRKSMRADQYKSKNMQKY